MEHSFLPYKNSRVSYYRYGTGTGIVICFHGYGEDGTLYGFWENHAGDQYTFYAIDLPFHGKTVWNEGLLFTGTDLSELISLVLNRHRLPPNHQVTLMGFSLGGRMALCLYQSHPEMIKKMILLAPDGLKINFWYRLATQNKWGNKLFAFSMKRPAWFLALLRFLNKLGWVNASVFKFVNFYTGNGQARQLLYQRWTAFRELKPNIREIKAVVRKKETPVRLVYGKYDRIILPARGEKFRKEVEEFCTLTIIDSGHQVLHPDHASQLWPLLPD